MNNIPKRKTIRIADYDYSTPGAYFITVCINDRKPILWNVVVCNNLNFISENKCGILKENAKECTTC